MNLVDRFLHYVSFDTQSDELTNLTPSTPGQMLFAQKLAEELERIGLTEVTLDDNGYLMASLPSNIDKDVPVVGFIAHLDTSPDMSGRHVSPRIVKNYDGIVCRGRYRIETFGVSRTTSLYRSRPYCYEWEDFVGGRR